MMSPSLCGKVACQDGKWSAHIRRGCTLRSPRLYTFCCYKSPQDAIRRLRTALLESGAAEAKGQPPASVGLLSGYGLFPSSS
jgi:hypothetical protein